MKKYKIYKLVDPRIIDENDPKKVRCIGWTNKKLSVQSYLKLDPFDSKGNRRMCKGRYFTKKI